MTEVPACVRTVDLMKKGLRLAQLVVFGEKNVRTVDLMKKGLRLTTKSNFALRIQKSKP